MKKAIEDKQRFYPAIEYGKIKYAKFLEDVSKGNKVTIDNEFSKELKKRFDCPYYFKSSKFKYQKEWRIIYPYRFKKDAERYVEMNIIGKRFSLPKNETFEKGRKTHYKFGRLTTHLVADYVSPFI